MSDNTRLFFAIWPSRETAVQIVGQADRLGIGGQRIPAERLHLTLTFHGACNAAQTEKLKALAGSVDLSEFDLTLDHIDYFRGPRITCIAPQHVPPSLEALAGALVPSVESRSFRPHVTIARKTEPIKRKPVAPCTVRVTDFTLVASGSAGQPGSYRILDCWPLKRN